MNQNKLERVGILGGTFDPIHAGHLGVAAEALKQFRLDRILFIPANVSPHKTQRVITASAHRLEMIRLAIQGEARFGVSDIEIARAGISYTIDTLDTLASQSPGVELFLILGADAFRDMATWKESRRLMETYNILVATRPGHVLEKQDDLVRDLSGGEHRVLSGAGADRFIEPGNFRQYQHCRTGKSVMVFEITPCPVSSSEIRSRVGNNKEIKNMLPLEVEHYIMRHQLYQAEHSPRTQ